MAQYISHLVQKERPDLIGLSEVFGEANREKLIAELSKTVAFRVIQPKDPNFSRFQWWEQCSGLLFLWVLGGCDRRIAPYHVEFHKFRDHHLWDGFARKGFLVAQLRIQDPSRISAPFRLDVAIAHMQNATVGFSMSRGHAVVQRQIKQLLRMLRARKAVNNTEFVIVADFNVPPRVLCDFVEGSEVVVAPPHGTTTDTSETLDYCVASTTSSPGGVLDTRVCPSGNDPSRNPSDHLPIVVSVRAPWDIVNTPSSHRSLPWTRRLSGTRQYELDFLIYEKLCATLVTALLLCTVAVAHLYRAA